MLNRIYLVGYMGSGKTGAAIALGKILKMSVADTDKMISAKTGMSISEIFSKRGQESFREMEREVLLSTISLKNTIISTGGGTPCFFDNMKWMNDNGITVYLEANPGMLFHRLASSRSGRPLLEKLNDADLMEQIMNHLVQRIPVYKQSAISINASSLDVKMLAKKIEEFVAL